MSAGLRNVLAAERARLGWSQTRMAEAAGITRQSYAAIEAGRSTPSTEVALRLAGALGRPVEALFALPDRRLPPERAHWAGTRPAWEGQPVRLCAVGGRRVAYPCAEAHRSAGAADGVVTGSEGAAVDVRAHRDRLPDLDLVAVGCDPAFGIVVDLLRHDHGIEVGWYQRGSRAALAALAGGEAHVAGVHLKDPDTNSWNGPWIDRLVPFPCTRISFSVWEQALLHRGDAARPMKTPADLGHPGVRLLNREPGSGSRALLEELLRTEGFDASLLAGYDTVARRHLDVARGIAAGAADAGVAILATARALGLEAIPLRHEAYELVIPDHFMDLTAIGRLLDLLRRPSVRQRVESLGGYDASTMGRSTT